MVQKNRKRQKRDFDQRKQCAAPIGWSKYTIIVKECNENKNKLQKNKVEGGGSHSISCLHASDLFLFNIILQCQFFSFGEFPTRQEFIVRHTEDILFYLNNCLIVINILTKTCLIVVIKT